MRETTKKKSVRNVTWGSIFAFANPEDEGLKTIKKFGLVLLFDKC
jgi:hypothetical protein